MRSTQGRCRSSKLAEGASESESSFGVCRKEPDYVQMVTIYYSTGSTVKSARICRAAARPSLTKHETNLKLITGTVLTEAAV